jgi:hypothetical protein
MTLSPTQILTIVLLATTLLLAVWVFILERRMKRLLAGKDAKSLEDTIVSLTNDIRALEKYSGS